MEFFFVQSYFHKSISKLYTKHLYWVRLKKCLFSKIIFSYIIDLNGPLLIKSVIFPSSRKDMKQFGLNQSYSPWCCENLYGSEVKTDFKRSNPIKDL